MIGLLQITTLPQGWTNSVPEFVRIIKKVLVECISNDCNIYINDILVKRLKITYNNEEAIPRV